ncbi:hypothetical protein Hanom_Chr05g00394041 [Helianthus anomalus]
MDLLIRPNIVKGSHEACYFGVKCHFSPCGLGHFASLVQRFHFSPMGPKRFHRCHFSPLGYLYPFFSVNEQR